MRDGIPDKWNDGLVLPDAGSAVKESACNARHVGSIPELGQSPGWGYGNLPQYSCLENSFNWGALLSTVHGVAKSHVTEHACMTPITQFCLLNPILFLVNLKIYFSPLYSVLSHLSPMTFGGIAISVHILQMRKMSLINVYWEILFLTVKSS